MKTKFLLFAVSIFTFIQGKSQNQMVFQYTGSAQTYTFAQSTCLGIEAWGAGGGKGGPDVAGQGGNGGGGAFAGQVLRVNAGDVLQIYTGGGGGYGVGGAGNGNQGAGGWGYGRGGAGGYAGYSGSSGGGAGGGGSSTILLNGNVILVAAGGGGGGGCGCADVGANGGGGGQPGQAAPYAYQDGASNYSNNANGAPGVDRGGGDGGGGGGGGGGWNGGSGGGVTSQGGTDCNYGGGAASGGGGTSLGFYTINGSGATPGFNNNPDLCGTCAVGATNSYTYGGNGLIVLDMSSAAFPDSIVNNIPLCSGATLSLSVPGPGAQLNFLWSGPGGTVSSNQNLVIPDVTLADSGMYTLAVMDTFGCRDTLSARVVVDTTPLVGIFPPDSLSCQRRKVALVAGASVPGTSYNWGAGISGNIDSVSSPGIYAVTATTPGGCTATAIAIVFVDSNSLGAATISMQNGSAHLCQGDSVTLTASAGTGYEWSNLATTQSIVVRQSNNYSVTVTQSAGCTASASQNVTINNNPVPEIAGGGPTTFCQGGSVILDAGNYARYLWNTGASDSSVTASQSGNYSVMVTDANGCTGTASQTVLVNNLPSPSISAGGPTTFCQGGSVILDAGNYAQYLWSTGASDSSVTSSEAGNYSVTVTDANGCTGAASKTVVVNNPPSPSISAGGPTTFCQGSSVILNAGNYAQYLWSTGAADSSVTASQPGNYSVTVTGANGCTAAASQTVVVNNLPSPSISAGGPTTFCLGGSVIFNAGSYVSYMWNNGNISQFDTVTSSSNYSVVVSDVHGCTGSASMTVTVNPLPVLQTVQIDSASCGDNNGSAKVSVENANGACTYLWNNNSTDSVLSNIHGGIYTVTVSNSSGCSATASVTVDSSSAIAPVNITSNKTIICPEDSTQICVSGVYASYAWSIGGAASCIYVHNAGDYYVTATNQYHCSAESNHLGIGVYPSPPVHIAASGDTLFGYDAYQYQWLFNNTAIPGATASLYVATESGFYTLQITDTDGCTELSQPDHIILTGIETSLGEEWLKVFPNPSATGTWQLVVSEGLLGSKLEIVEASGKIVYKDVIRNTITELSPQLPGGIYLLQITTGDKVAGIKLVKLK